MIVVLNPRGECFQDQMCASCTAAAPLQQCSHIVTEKETRFD
jgi:hypothetical protein